MNHYGAKYRSYMGMAPLHRESAWWEHVLSLLALTALWVMILYAGMR